jgi:hypothetical protein
VCLSSRTPKFQVPYNIPGNSNAKLSALHIASHSLDRRSCSFPPETKSPKDQETTPSRSVLLHLLSLNPFNGQNKTEINENIPRSDRRELLSGLSFEVTSVHVLTTPLIIELPAVQSNSITLDCIPTRINHVVEE